MNPVWADELKRRYLRGESSQFVLHGNVHDLVLHNGKLHDLVDYLGRELLAPSKDIVLEYNLSSGVRFLKKDVTIDGLEELFLPRSADKVLPALEKLLLTSNRVAVIISYAEMVAPAADVSFSTEADRQSVIALHRWSLSPILEKSDNLVVLLTENLSELHAKLVGNPRTVSLQIGMPDEAARAEVIKHVTPQTEATFQKRLAEVTAGLKAVQLKALLEPHGEMPDDPAALAAREKYITTLLGNAPNAGARAKKMAQLTAGMSQDDIRDLVAPGATAPADNDEQEQLLRLIYKRKREIIERECFGLIEFVESNHDFSVVGGIEEVKGELLAIAKNMREGRRARCPMGLLFTGPMGTGKTFVAEAFVRETGLTAVKLGNFRSKWVGATEGNLDRVLSVIRAIGQIVVIIDEGDRSFGSGEGESDGGTSSRVIARIKEFMSDTSNRGRVMFVLMTNRPDKLDIDIKRAGRLDKKIPFVYPQEPVEVEAVLGALLRKHRITHSLKLPNAQVSTPLVGYSNAEIEAVVLLANEYAGDKTLEEAHLTQALRDYLPSRDEAMLEYMELIAVFEASNRKMLPKKYAEMSNDALRARLNELRLTVGSRR